jgi:hypothetical protein
VQFVALQLFLHEVIRMHVTARNALIKMVVNTGYAVHATDYCSMLLTNWLLWGII